MTQLKDSIIELNIHTYLVRRFLGNLCGHAQTFANGWLRLTTQPVAR